MPVIDPTVVNGDVWAGYINQWIPALHSLHAGTARPPYAVPGMAWIDTSAGTVWRLKVVLDAGSPGLDATIAAINPTTGDMTVPIDHGGTGAKTAADARTMLGLGALAIRDTVGNAQIAAASLSIDRFASGTPNALLGFDSSGTAAIVARSSDIELPRRVSEIASGAYGLSVFRMADGSIRAVGAGTDYANGDRTAAAVYFPERIAFSERPATSIVKVVVNGTSCYALTSGGVVYAWGNNQYGQLGIGNTTNQPVAQPIEYFRTNGILISEIIQVRVGGVLPRAAFFRTTTGLLYACGQNADSECGDNTTSPHSTPIRCGTLTGVTSVSVSAYPHHVLALAASGLLWGWGDNSSGAIGIGTTDDVKVPTQITGLSGTISAIRAVGGTATDGSSGIGCSYALKSDGTLWSVGNNTWGQLGLSDTTQRLSWTQITTLARPVTQFSVCEGRGVTVAARIDGVSGGEGWVWGHNGNGQCGIPGVTTNQQSPQKPSATWQNSVTKVAVGGSVFDAGVVVQAGNEMYAAGYNTDSNLGVGDASAKSTFTRVLVPPEITLSDWGIRGAINQWGIWILTTDGRVEMCGNGTNGQLGIREEQIRNMPIFATARF